jgi:hypothetical protein
MRIQRVSLRAYGVYEIGKTLRLTTSIPYSTSKEILARKA